MYKNIIIVLSITIFITKFANAQQIINPNIKHDWENNRYTVNNNNTVEDNKTNLIWKKCSQGLSDITCTTGTATTYNWQGALDLANNSTFAGFTDWRLPNIKELISLEAYDRHNPAINITIFPNTPVNFFWSSSLDTNDNSGAWVLDSGTNTFVGSTNSRFRSNDYYVRLVRGGRQ